MMTIQLHLGKMNWSMKKVWKKKKVIVIDAGRRRMTACWVLSPFRKEVWCCERLAGSARRWFWASPGAVVSQVPCRNAFATTQTCSGESMTDPFALQCTVCVDVCARAHLCVCLTLCLGEDAAYPWHVKCSTYKTDLRAPCWCQIS